MNFLDKLDALLCRTFRYEDIEKNGRLYLRRWFIKQSREKGGIYLHRIKQSDTDPDPHDHPWDFKTLILWGGYTDCEWEWLDVQDPEVGCASVIKCRIKLDDKPCHVGHTYERRAEHIHQVKLHPDPKNPDGQEAWTLVTVGPYRRDWNFITKYGPVFWRKYLNYWGPDLNDPER